ncbi:MAG: sensor domain-containing phosphodiesterase, partial [Sporomusaceae bacterium]|nr:sensor domain-containing phosphodiesterase [Sporomusaceae bacterium]
MKNQTLRRQFRIWTILLVLVPSLLVMTIYTISQIKIAREKSLELVSERVHSQERLINYWILERANEVRKITHLEVFRNLDEQQMKVALHVMQQDSENFNSLSYIDKD